MWHKAGKTGLIQVLLVNGQWYVSKMTLLEHKACLHLIHTSMGTIIHVGVANPKATNSQQESVSFKVSGCYKPVDAS